MQSISNSLHTLSGLDHASLYLLAIKARAQAKFIGIVAIGSATCQIDIYCSLLREARHEIWSGYKKPEEDSASEAQEQAWEYIPTDVGELDQGDEETESCDRGVEVLVRKRLILK